MKSIPMMLEFISGNIRPYPGKLFRLPEELATQEALLCARSHETDGWHDCHLGYRTFIVTDQEGTRFIFPCLLVKGHEESCEEINGYDISFDESSIEEFAESAISLRNDLRQEIEEDANILVHDLRKLNTSVYHKAIACQLSLQSGNISQAYHDITTVLAAIKLLKLRTDTLDLTSNLERELLSENLKTGEKIKEVVDAFTPSASQKDIGIIFESTMLEISFVHELFQLVPYIIIDNAVKYSPRDSSISVKSFVKNGFVHWQISSVGPAILESEEAKIFEKGNRGKQAIKSKVPGTGYGLFLAKLLVNRFGGELSYLSELLYKDEREVEYAQNTFTFTVPFSKKENFFTIEIKY